jgi:hypothetical protein
VVVLTTGETTTTGVLPVLPDTTVTGRDVTSVLAGVGESGRHLRRAMSAVGRRVYRSGEPPLTIQRDAKGVSGWETVTVYSLRQALMDEEQDAFEIC